MGGSSGPRYRDKYMNPSYPQKEGFQSNQGQIDLSVLEEMMWEELRKRTELPKCKNNLHAEQFRRNLWVSLNGVLWIRYRDAGGNWHSFFVLEKKSGKGRPYQLGPPGGRRQRVKTQGRKGPKECAVLTILRETAEEVICTPNCNIITADDIVTGPSFWFHERGNKANFNDNTDLICAIEVTEEFAQRLCASSDTHRTSKQVFISHKELYSVKNNKQHYVYNNGELDLLAPDEQTADSFPIRQCVWHGFVDPAQQIKLRPCL